jgi:hypothetical protein
VVGASVSAHRQRGVQPSWPCNGTIPTADELFRVHTREEKRALDRVFGILQFLTRNRDS